MASPGCVPEALARVVKHLSRDQSGPRYATWLNAAYSTWSEWPAPSCIPVQVNRWECFSKHVTRESLFMLDLNDHRADQDFLNEESGIMEIEEKEGFNLSAHNSSHWFMMVLENMDDLVLS